MDGWVGVLVVLRIAMDKWMSGCILYKRKKKVSVFLFLCLGKSCFWKRTKIVYSMERLAVRAVNESKAGIGKIRSYLKKFLKEKKIVYSMERLAVRA